MLKKLVLREDQGVFSLDQRGIVITDTNRKVLIENLTQRDLRLKMHIGYVITVKSGETTILLEFRFKLDWLSIEISDLNLTRRTL